MPLTFTLRADGPTDAMLMPILRWALMRVLPDTEIQGQFADPKLLPRSADRSLSTSLRAAIEYFPCDLLFIHRDAEKQDPEVRVEEINLAARNLDAAHSIPVIPVRMSEAWLLIDESALRRAAGNPNGRVPLTLPTLQDIEQISDPKETLQTLLKSACELKGRRLKAFRAHECVPLLSELIQDFAPLQHLSAFRRLSSAIALFAEAFRKRTAKRPQ